MSTSGVYNSLDIFQEKMNVLFQGFEYIYVYLDDLLILMTGNWTDHLTKLVQVLIELKEKGLKYNIEKSSFEKSEIEYLGFWATREGVRSTEKIEAIVDMAPPGNRKEVRRLTRKINYYRDMWSRRSHMLQALTKLTSVCVKFKWTPVEK